MPSRPPEAHAAPLKASVLVIREIAEQLSASDCCGKLGPEQIPRAQSLGPLEDPRVRHERAGALAEGLRRRLGERAEVHQVDPRNLAYLVPKLVRDYWVYRPPLGAFARAVFLFFSPPALIVNGRVLASRELPDEARALALVEGAAAARRG